ncbi:hypothetical protein JCM8097_006543 [Rhodosporidiobolus ruineniae]
MLLLVLAILAFCYKEQLMEFLATPVPVQTVKGEPKEESEEVKGEKEDAKAAVLLLSGDGDQLNSALIKAGEVGGRQASEQLHSIVHEVTGGEMEVVVNIVSNSGATTALAHSRFTDAFLRGLGSTSHLTFLVPPQNGPGGFAERIIQLLSLYIDLDSVSHILVGSLHSQVVVDYLSGVPAELRSKIILVSTINLVSSARELVEDQGYVATSALVGRRALPSPVTTPALKPFKVPSAKLGMDRPCNAHYLSPSGCSVGASCQYSHDYSFTVDEWNAFPAYIKQFICPYLRDKGYCMLGDECYMGHRCPYTLANCRFGDRCHYLKAGLPHSERV